MYAGLPQQMVNSSTSGLTPQSRNGSRSPRPTSSSSQNLPQLAAQSNGPQSQSATEPLSKEQQSRFRVVLRLRPLLDNEKKSKRGKYLSAVEHRNMQSLQLQRPEKDTHIDFHYDRVLGLESDQQDSYEQIAQPVVDDVLNGYNGVIMAYGQTGSGKTHTIFGSKPQSELQYQQGIVPLSVDQIFTYVKSNPN